MDFFYDYDNPCPKCGHEPTHYRDCSELGCEDGAIDESEEDFCLPGTVLVSCETCHGTGIEQWCPKCGYEFRNKDFFTNEEDER